MEKDIKDYLHLYLPFEIERYGDIFKIIGFYSLTDFVVQLYHEHGHINERWDKIKLPLRPISDITEKEAWEVWRQVESPHHRHVTNPRHVFVYGSDLPLFDAIKVTKALLSKHFDLFGLIESGLAIDKTKS